jgi:hypothetical protein
MALAQHNPSARSVARARRRDAIRVVIVAALVPLLVLSIFRGADLLIHGHQGESAHVHLSPLGVESEANVAANAHDEAHGHSHTHERGFPADHADDSPLGVQVTIQDHEQLPSRKTDLVPDLGASAASLAVAHWTSALLSIVDPDCPERPPATRLIAARPTARFGDRLASTSNAFLI